MPEAVIRGCSVKKMLLKISQNSQENTCARVSFLIKLHAATVMNTGVTWANFPPQALNKKNLS